MVSVMPSTLEVYPRVKRGYMLSIFSAAFDVFSDSARIQHLQKINNTCGLHIKYECHAYQKETWFS